MVSFSVNSNGNSTAGRGLDRRARKGVGGLRTSASVISSSNLEPSLRVRGALRQSAACLSRHPREEVMDGNRHRHANVADRAGDQSRHDHLQHLRIEAPRIAQSFLMTGSFRCAFPE